MRRHPNDSSAARQINVWRPAGTTARSNLPVMFFIHGGAWAFGSGGSIEEGSNKKISVYDGGKLASHDVIMVTINCASTHRTAATHPHALFSFAPLHLSVPFRALTTAACCCASQIVSPHSVSCAPLTASAAVTADSTAVRQFGLPFHCGFCLCLSHAKKLTAGCSQRSDRRASVGERQHRGVRRRPLTDHNLRRVGGIAVRLHHLCLAAGCRTFPEGHNGVRTLRAFPSRRGRPQAPLSSPPRRLLSPLHPRPPLAPSFARTALTHGSCWVCSADGVRLGRIRGAAEWVREDCR